MNPNNHNENIAAGMGGGRVQAMQPQQQPHNDPTEALESKLHSAIAQLRQSRNEAHRQQQMAANRVKLVTAGVQAVTDAIQQASAQLSGLQEQMAESEPALDEANAAVQRSTKEASVLRLSQCYNVTKIIVSLLAFLCFQYDFQHAELLYKQNQLQAQRALVQTRTAERQKALTKLRSLVHAKRQQMLVWKQAQEQAVVAHQEVPIDMAALWAWTPEHALSHTGPLEPTALVEAWKDYEDFAASYQHAQARRWAAWIRADAAQRTAATETIKAVAEQLAVIADGYKNQNRHETLNNHGEAAAASVATQPSPRSSATTPPPSPLLQSNGSDAEPLPEAVDRVGTESRA
jgi:hypothetical protein